MYEINIDVNVINMFNLLKSFLIIIKKRRSLDRFVADNFPIKSTDLPESSPHFKDYIAAIDRVNAEQF